MFDCEHSIMLLNIFNPWNINSSLLVYKTGHKLLKYHISNLLDLHYYGLYNTMRSKEQGVMSHLIMFKLLISRFLSKMH